MLHSIQLMRALAALFVVIGHSIWKSEQYGDGALTWFTMGGAGVDLFFIISGFIMCWSTQKKPLSAAQFILARIKRIIPLYWLLTTVALVIYILWPEKINSGSDSGTSIIASYFLLPSDASYLLAVGWTLSFEFYFYLIFSLGIFAPPKYRYALPITLLVCISAAGFVLNPESAAFMFFTNSIILEFVFGILIFVGFQRYKPSPIVACVSFSIGALILVFSPLMHLPRFIHYGLPCMFIFIGLLGAEGAISSRPQLKRVSHLLGDSSYSLYLSHPFSLVIAAIILSKLGLHQYGEVFIVVLTLFAVICGYMCFIICEKTLNKLVKKLPF